MTYAVANSRRAARSAFRFSTAGRAHLDGLGAFYPPSLGDICSCGLGLTPAEISSVGGGALSVSNVARSGAPVSTQIESSIGTSLLTAAPFTGPAAPFVAVAGLAAHFLAAMGVGSGCGQTCVLSSQYADQAETLLQRNLDTYFSLAAPRDPAARAAALRVFDAIWSDLSQACGNPALGDAGKRCITDRQSGACVWRQNKTPQYPGIPQIGECWNWFSGYRDPIANDPDVAPVYSAPALDASGFNPTPAGAIAPGASDAPNYLLLAGLLAGVALLVGVN